MHIGVVKKKKNSPISLNSAMRSTEHINNVRWKTKPNQNLFSYFFPVVCEFECFFSSPGRPQDKQLGLVYRNQYFKLQVSHHRLRKNGPISKLCDEKSIAQGETAFKERTYRDWFHKFNNGEDKKYSGRQVYKDVELEALLEKDYCQTQEGLILEVPPQTISHRWKSFKTKEVGINVN